MHKPAKCTRAPSRDLLQHEATPLYPVDFIHYPLNPANVTDLDILRTIDDLEHHYGAPSAQSRKKVSNILSDPMQRWLSYSPFFVLSTYSSDGIDCSPRGDRAGEAFRILDESTIAIPDRRGNNRIDTLRNLITDPRIGLLFLVPGVDEAMRVKGSASISINDPLRQSFCTDNDDAPATVILVNIDLAFMQNARAVRRAKLWNSASHVDNDVLPSTDSLTLGRSDL